MLTTDSVISRGLRPHLRIGMGAGEDRRKVIDSAEAAQRTGHGAVTIYDDPVEMARDLRDGRIDAAVRGDLDSNDAMSAVREAFGVPKVLRAAFMKPEGGRLFLLAPVGVDEGWTVPEKVELARLCAATVRRLGVEPVIGMMSGGRSSDKGRMAEVDRTIDDALQALSILAEDGLRAKDVQILIEDAVKDCDVIIAPDGISGNLIFRTLHFLGGGVAMGAPVLNIDRVYIDTSRAKASYVDSVALAAALADERDRAIRPPRV
ncbi:methanogenesis marker protein Mmp4/MtxX [Methanomassiliicoccus luminyensis]|jgi:putative methanogen marker protein 4|uniref:methanogenesis marker protein Mmp4/MtxX n=1 Tax=Methanomassiliicoccus luminyensis TaxID=1080712 RepID=UPI000368C0E3|nr:methanogenesis marker protein Mmp4/MtxX [Methanomassiliicoccus luminyensis]